MTCATDCQLFEQSPLAMAYLEPATARIEAVNACTLATLARSEAELIGRDPIELGWINATQWRTLIARLEADGQAAIADFSLSPDKTQTRQGQLNAAFMRTAGRQLVWLSFIDQSAQQNLDYELDRLRRLARHFFFESPDALSLTDPYGRVIEANQAAANLIKRQPAELTGRVYWDAFPDPIDARMQREWQSRIMASEVPLIYEEQPSVTFSGRHFHVIAQALRDEQGQPVAVKKIRRDISARVADEVLDRQRNRMEAIGTLAAGIAHDFNNILGGVILNSELALLEQSLTGETRNLLDNILTAGKRARDLINQIQTFSRQDVIQKAPLDLVPLVHESLRFLRATIPANIQINLTCECAEAWTTANAAQLNQAIANLVTNAERAIAPRAGTISLELKARSLGDAGPAPFDLRPGQYWELSVADDGCGMPPEVAARAHEPFFTTRAETSGMGLAVVLGIIQDLGGALSLASQPDHGTRVAILLPSLQAGENLEQTPEQTGLTRVMLVEDDPIIRSATAKMLAKLGCAVTICPEAQQALDLLAAELSGWDLLITDLSLPGIQGLDLARQIKLFNPALPIILSTGYHDAVGAAALNEAGVSLILEKPFTRSELAQSLKAALGDSKHG